MQQQISRISASTWEQINHQLLVSAETDRLERGQVIRLDSTAIDAPIHAPTDSRLLWDGVRVLARLFDQAQAQEEDSRLPYQNHSRKAKQLARSLVYTRGKDKKARLYIDLLKLTQKSLSYIDPVYQALKHSSADLAQTLAWYADINHYRGLIKRVMSQTIRRVCDGEKVPAQAKIFSLFEDHTDIIVKGSRDIQYGHKLNLMTGQSGLVLDVVIETGNPTDTERFIPMLDRHIKHYGRVPRQIATDGGYASVANLNDAQAKGVKDVAFHKKKGLSVGDMTRSDWVYRKLRNFRAGIEAGISYLKRSFGLGRCTWKGLAHFKSYVWASVVTHNLVTLARLKLA